MLYSHSVYCSESTLPSLNIYPGLQLACCSKMIFLNASSNLIIGKIDNMNLKRHEKVTNNIDIEIFCSFIGGQIEWGSLNIHKIYGEDGLMKINGMEYVQPTCQQAVNMSALGRVERERERRQQRDVMGKRKPRSVSEKRQG